MRQFRGSKRDRKYGLHKEGAYLKVRDNANEYLLDEGKEKTLEYYNSNADSCEAEAEPAPQETVTAWRTIVQNIEEAGIMTERKSILIKDTTREERIQIVQQGLSQCGGACDFCNGCDNLGGGSIDAFYQPYIDGEKELREINMEYRSNSGMVHG